MTAPVAADLTTERLTAIAPALLGDRPLPGPGADIGSVLDVLVRAVRDEPRPESLWLLYVAVTGRFPDADEFLDAHREFELNDVIGVTIWLLDRAVHGPGDTRGWRLELLTDRVLVDVDFSARHALHTGIQRVVRSTVPHWAPREGVVPVVWSPAASAYRRCTAEETARVLRWGEPTVDASGVAPASDDPTGGAGGPDGPDEVATLVVPWRSRVVLLEVPPRAATARLAALARYSGSSIVGVGHDCIPIASGLLMPPDEPNKFVDYLSVVKHMDHIVGVSASAANEFQGFADMVAAQGLAGPRVSVCRLPVERAAPVTTPAPAGPPTVLCVGSFEPRKNQGAVLHAAERLWREGLQFRLLFVGGGGWGSAFPQELRRLRRHRRPVTQLTAIDEAELAAAYAHARFTVLVSLHEGYGLPVAESFAHGVPALVTDYGSVAETGTDGGVLTVDPRDDDAVTDGMRRLLTDDALVARLRAEIAARPTSSWRDYADTLWDLLAAGAPRG